MPSNWLRSKSGISLTISYRICASGSLFDANVWSASDIYLSFEAPRDFGLLEIEGVLLGRYFEAVDGFEIWSDRHIFTAHVCDDGDATSRFIARIGEEIDVLSITDKEIINIPQIAFKAGDSWQEDPVQGDDWRNHNFNFAWLGTPDTSEFGS